MPKYPLELSKILRNVRRFPDESYAFVDISPLQAMQLKALAPEHNLLYRGKLGKRSELWDKHPMFTTQDPFHAANYANRHVPTRESTMHIPRLQVYQAPEGFLESLPTFEDQQAWDQLITPLNYRGEGYPDEFMQSMYAYPGYRLKNIGDSRLLENLSDIVPTFEDQFLIMRPGDLTRRRAGGPVR